MKWIKSLTVKPQATNSYDLDFILKVTYANLKKARESGDAFLSAHYSQQLDELRRLRHEEGLDLD